MVDLHNISFLPIFLYSSNPTLSSLQFSPEPPLTQRGERMRPLLLDPPYYSVSRHPLASSHVQLGLWTSSPSGCSLNHVSSPWEVTSASA